MERSNDQLAQNLIQAMHDWGIQECCMAPGSRNAPLLLTLIQRKEFKLYFWPEERSAAFFALGRIKAAGLPVAVVTTSGTAAGELLPATMEAYYSGLPLLLITADRPRRYRGSGAPQSAEQVGLFGCYTSFAQDLERGESVCVDDWEQTAPAHVNVCFEEPKKEVASFDLPFKPSTYQKRTPSFNVSLVEEEFYSFWSKTQFPFVIVGALDEKYREAAVNWLSFLQAPVYLEATSGIREEARLAHLRISRANGLWEFAQRCNYPIDGVLRIGGVPTVRLWRDLEDGEGKYRIYNLSELPFSGLSWSKINPVDLNAFFSWGLQQTLAQPPPFSTWKAADERWQKAVQELYFEEPRAEPSMVHHLSRLIPPYSKVYLGNSLPIREWDLAAVFEKKNFAVAASRGVNGIDGQISTFLGFSSSDVQNWGLVGDLTALYDLAGPWISSQLDMCVNLAIINNGGGQIFQPMFGHDLFLNQHQLNFKSFASFWNWDYEYWERVPSKGECLKGFRLIEIVPDNQATQRFNRKLGAL